MNSLKKTLIVCCAAISLSSVAAITHARDISDRCKNEANKEECRHSHIMKFQAMKQQKLHDELKITAAQEPAWKAFTESFRPSKPPKDGNKPSRSEAEKIPAPDRFEQHLARMEQRHDAMKARLPVLKAFYAELTPEQQAIFNKHAARFESHHRHRHHGQKP